MTPDVSTFEREFCLQSATVLAELIRRRRVSPVEVPNAVLDRIDRLNPALNVYSLILSERARGPATRKQPLTEASRLDRCTPCRFQSKTTSCWPVSPTQTGHDCSPTMSPSRRRAE